MNLIRRLFFIVFSFLLVPLFVYSSSNPEFLARQFFRPSMSDAQKEGIIHTIENIPAADRENVIRYTSDFCTATMDEKDVVGVMEAIAQIPAADRASVLRRAHIFFKPRTSANSRIAMIQAISQIPTADRTNVLQLAQTFFNFNTSVESQTTFINLIAHIPAVERDHVLQQARSLFTPHMSTLDKLHILAGLEIIPHHDREAVIQHTRNISIGVEGFEKRKWMEVMRRIPPQEREGLIQQMQILFTPQMHFQNKQDIMYILGTIPADQRDAVIQRVLERFREAERREETQGAEENVMMGLLRREANPYRERDHHFINPFAVHQYADTEVALSSDAPHRPSGPSQRGEACADESAPIVMKLNDAILHKINQILGKGVHHILSLPHARVLIEERIPHIWATPQDQHQARTAFNKGFEGGPLSDIQDLCVIVTFLQLYHPETNEMDRWIIGFLGESMTAYDGGAQESIGCVKSIRERAVLGLRGIDPELDKIFKQVEGPKLAEWVFISSNIGAPKGCLFVASTLKKLGYIPAKTTPEEGAKLYEHYLLSLVNEYPRLKERFGAKEIGLLTETIEMGLSPGGPLRKYLRPPVAPKPKSGQTNGKPN